MCNLIDLQLAIGTVRVADIKAKYIKFIAEMAHTCPHIDKIVIFGSSIEERCTEESDIDIAIFSSKDRYDLYRLKSYKDFKTGIYRFDFSQDYDFLYFKSGKEHKDAIISNIQKGEVIYERQ